MTCLKNYREIYVSCILICISWINVMAQGKGDDFFADIVNREQQGRFELLEEKQPPVLPQKFLNIEKGKKFAVDNINEIDTKEELVEQLAIFKKNFTPFLKSLAPELTCNRKKLELNKFLWREETEEDKKNFIATLQGKGDWEEVSIPHFDAPYGRAVTYYYKNIDIPENMLMDKSLFICFNGVDYIANVFLNGAYVGSHEGFFAPFEFNISKYAKPGENKLLIKVENDYTTTGFVAAGKERVFGDKIYAVTGVGYDNFYDGGHQCAAGMGIYQDCFLESRDPIHVNDIFIRPLIDEQAAEISLEVNNYFEQKKPVKFKVSLFGENFEKTVIRDSIITPSALHVPGIGDLQKPTDWKRTDVRLGYGVNYFSFKIKIPEYRKWSNSSPWLYQLQVDLINDKGNITDSYEQNFGMRSFKMDTISSPKGMLYLNNEKIRLRGTNTMGFLQQDVYKKDFNQLIDDILLAKVCNMNFLRITQRPVQPEIYDYCDKLGLMVQTDFPTFGGIRYNKWEECVRQVAEMERLIRNHPSCILSTYINERFPNGEGHPHRNMAKPEQYFSLFRAMDEAVLKENPDRVIKKSDGDYDPPTPGLPDNHCYNTWYNGQGLGIGKLYKGYWQWVKPNWYYGCGEFGAEGLDPIETMNKFYPKEWLPKNKKDEKKWTANKIYAAQTHKFHYMWYNTQYSLKDWVEASQQHQAWALKTVTEAFRRDTNMVSFAVHLFIDAWPAGWMKTIMDVDRNPKKGFFAYKKALKPTIVSLRSDRNQFFDGEIANIEAWVCNDLNVKHDDYKLNYQIEKKGKVVASGTSMAVVPKNSAEFQGYVPFQTPKVNRRTKFSLKITLFDDENNDVDQTSFDFDVFPQPEKKYKKSVIVLNKENSVGREIIDNLNINENDDLQNSEVVLIDNFQLYKDKSEYFNELAETGKRIILFNVPVGEHNIGNTDVLVQNTSMGSYYFTSPFTNHRFTKNAEPFDFKMWYDEKAGYIEPFLDKIVISDDWSSVLASGNTNWEEDKGKASAVAELKIGDGEIFICQLDLKNRLKTNPVAFYFLEKMLFQK